MFRTVLILSCVIILSMIAAPSLATPVEAEQTTQTETQVQTSIGNIEISLTDGIDISFSGMGTGGSVTTSEDGDDTTVTLDQSMNKDTENSAHKGLCAVGLSGSNSPTKFETNDDNITMTHTDSNTSTPNGVNPEHAVSDC